MKKQFLSNRSWGGIVALGLSALLLLPATAQGGQIDLKPYNRGRGLQSPVRTPAERDLARPTRVSGDFEYSLRDGLTLGGKTVQITSRTSVFPNFKGSSTMPDPAELEGYRATVYGRPGPNGVEAVLLILDLNTRYGVTTQDPANIQQFQLGDGGAAPIELGDNVPR